MDLSVNNQSFALDIPDDMPLLWALRDHCELSGTKFGCGKGLCGACTVFVDGEVVRACLTPVSAVVGKKVTTIEGLNSAVGESLQAAWLAHDVAQCGYCQSGQLMAATALLTQNANPSDEQIATAMTGNICRCATYARIRTAVKEAAAKLV